MTNLGDCFFKVDEAYRRSVGRNDTAPSTLLWTNLTLAKNRVERVLRKDMLDIGDEQLLMLLFVMDAEDHDRLDLLKKFFICARNEVVGVRIDG